ncbi:MAG TPA: NlpC/P60 family protein [Ktedonobacteraceae bacterium]|nr:NlpC/P60 family protein [Ktedonobacteraceae bacterium]
MTTYVIATAIADVRSHPDPTSELVTQALMNTAVELGENRGEWTFVTLSDYTGWVRNDELEEPIVKGFCKVGECCGTPLHFVAVISSTHTPLYSDTNTDYLLGYAYLSTMLPLLDITDANRVQVALPGERTAWLSRAAVEISRQETILPRSSIEAITNHAYSFLGVPYLWGGTSYEGIDCSGFVQLCYRTGGYVIPRDADQQHAFLQQQVDRNLLQEGDLIFFGRQEITHVAMALNNHEYIHSEGQLYNCVTINSFDPGDDHYDKRLDEIYWGAKRVIL